MFSRTKQIWRGLPRNGRFAAYVAAFIIFWMLTGLIGGGEESHGEKELPLKNVAVKTFTPQPFVRTVTLTGRSAPKQTVSLSAQTAGQVEEIFIEQGDYVTKGTVLIKIDPATRDERLRAAKASVKEAQALYDTAKRLNAEGYRSDADVTAREAQLASAREALAGVEQDITYTRVESPINGYVERRHVEKGDYVNIGSPTFNIIGQDQFLLTAQLPQRNYDDVQPGQSVKATLLSGQEIEGIVTYKASNADEFTKTYALEMTVDGKKYRIPTGMTATIHIPVETIQALRVPHSALVLKDAGTLAVATVDGSNVHLQSVTMLTDDSDAVWLTGIDHEADIIIRGQSSVTEGEEVNVQKEAEKTTKDAAMTEERAT